MVIFGYPKIAQKPHILGIPHISQYAQYHSILCHISYRESSISVGMGIHAHTQYTPKSLKKGCFLTPKMSTFGHHFWHILRVKNGVFGQKRGVKKWQKMTKNDTFWSIFWKTEKPRFQVFSKKICSESRFSEKTRFLGYPKNDRFSVFFGPPKNTPFLGDFQGDQIWYYILMQYLGFGQNPKKRWSKRGQKRGSKKRCFLALFGKQKNGVFERLDLGVPQKTPKKGCFLTPKNTSFSVPKYQVRIWVHICQSGKNRSLHFLTVFGTPFWHPFSGRSRDRGAYSG